MQTKLKNRQIDLALTDLSDTPSSLTGYSGQVLTVNATEDAFILTVMSKWWWRCYCYFCWQCWFQLWGRWVWGIWA